MKGVNKSGEPAGLQAFRGANPNATWDDFKNVPGAYQELLQHLYVDQGGLCVYCEIEVLLSPSSGLGDYCVEHFHPKSVPIVGKNPHIEWANLFLACKGGSCRYVAFATDRFDEDEKSCDASKANSVPDCDASPIVLPHDQLFVQIKSDAGELLVDEERCQALGLSYDSIDRLFRLCNLRARRLNRLRRETLATISDELGFMLSSGRQIQDAVAIIRAAHLRADGILRSQFESSVEAFLS